MKPISLYLVFTCFNPNVVSGFTLLFHDWTDLQSISLDFFCSKGLLLTNKIHGCLHILVVFGHERGQGYLWGVHVVLWYPSDCLALYGGYLGNIDGFYSAGVFCGNWKFPDLILLGGLF